MHPAANLSSKEFWKTPQRGFINVATGEFRLYPSLSRFGGDPYRSETDEEYQARLAKHDAGETSS